MAMHPAPMNDNGSAATQDDDFADEMQCKALFYRQCGLSVIPVRGKQYTYGENEEEKEKNSKAPLVKWTDYQKRFATEEEIEEWFDKWPLANIGFATGEVSGVVVVDFDSREAVLMAKEKGYLNTPVVRTGRGCHAYYRYPRGREIRNSTDGGIKTDIRGNGGYVVLPPSIHYSGRQYRWVKSHEIGDIRFGELPEEFIARSVRNSNNGSRKDLKQLYQGVVKGSRNDTLARLCGSWINDGLDESECLMMAHTWNKMNNPPMPDREIESVINSIMRYRKVDQGYAGEIFSQDRNVFNLPLFARYEKKTGKPGKIECRIPVKESTLAWTVHASAEYGLGGAFDELVFSAIMEVVARLGLPVRNPVNIGNFWEIAKYMEIEKPSADCYREIAKSIKRIATISINARLVSGGKTSLETMFNIFDKVLFKTGKEDGGYYNMVYLSDALLKSVNAGYLSNIDLKTHRLLKSPVARALYRVIACVNKDGRSPVTISYREICERIGLFRYEEPLKAKQQLSPIHRELIAKKAVKTALWSGDNITYNTYP